VIEESIWEGDQRAGENFRKSGEGREKELTIHRN
jgi:hypothetical protein